MHAVVGIIERDGGTLYCSAVYLGPGGQILGKLPATAAAPTSAAPRARKAGSRVAPPSAV